MAQTWRRRRAWLLLHLIIWSDCGISALRDSYTDAQAASLDRAEHEEESSDIELLSFGRTPLSSSLLQALFAEEPASSATASQLQARAQLQAATGRLRRSTVALTELLTGQGDELVEMLQTTEATADEFGKAPKDPKMIQHALQVSKQMVDLVNEVKSSDKAIQQSLAKTGDPLVYDDGSINRSDIPDPGEEVGRLAEGIAKLARKRGDDKMLKKTEGKIVEHMIAVEKMVDGAKADIRNSRCVDPRDMLADEPENDTAGLVESFSTDAAGTDTDDEGLVAESWEIDEMDVDTGHNRYHHDIRLVHVRHALELHFGVLCAKAKDSMDAFTRVQVSAVATSKDYISDPRRFMIGSTVHGCQLSTLTAFLC
eukprot:s1162_g3.t1